MSIKRTIRHILFLATALAVNMVLTAPLYAEKLSQRGKPIQVGDTFVERVPVPTPDSLPLGNEYADIHFRLDKADLDVSYMDNGLSLLYLEHVIDSIGVDNIHSIEIISQSSPEGPLERNKWLTEHRSQAMMKYITNVYPQLKDRITLNKVAEAWDNLARYVAQDPNLEETTKDKILDIIKTDKLSLAAKKESLKKSLGSDPNTGDVYAYLTKYYYPVIRNSSIYVFHLVQPVVSPEPEKPFAEELSPTPVDSIPYDNPLPLPDDGHKRPFISVKTNLVYDAFFKKDMGWAPIYNIEAELYPTEDGRWTWMLEYDFPWHTVPSKHQYLQILNLQFEGRRYFKAASNHTGHYLSAYIGANLYDVCFDKETGHGYQGEGGGVGLGYGYVMPLGKKPDTRWKLEFFIKGGFYMTFYDPYDAGAPFAGKYYYEWYEAPSLFIRRNMLFRWFGPTGGGITLSYDLIYKKAKKR